MKKTRKLSAFLTALCLTGTMLSALPVNAEDTAYAIYSYAVIGTDNAEHPTGYILADSSGDTWCTNADYFDITLAVGDMITIKNAMIGVTCIEGTNSLSIYQNDGYSAEKTGSILDNPKTAEFTVQEIQTGSQFGNRVYLEKDGVRYHIFTDWIEKNYAEYSYLDWESVSVGDTVTCILYDDYPVIGLNSALPFTAQEFFIVKGTHHSEEETAVRMDYYYYSPNLSVNTKYPHRYVYYTGNLDSMNLSYGDILLADGGFTTVQEETTKAYELILDEGTTLTKAGNCSDFMEAKKLTVASSTYDGHPLEPFFSIWTYRLTDTDGNSYYYSEDSWNSLFHIESRGYSQGDTVTFAVWQDSAIIPLSEAVPRKTEYAVIATDNAEHPTSYILVNNKGETFLTGTDAFSETFAVGDMISIQNAEILSTCMAGTNTIGIEPQENYSVQKDGSILENLQTAEFTVTSVPDMDSGINFAQLEKDGNLYQIFTDWIEAGSAEYGYLDWNTVSVGDTVTCILYDNYPVIGTALVSEKENPYQRFFIVTDAENHIAEYYYHINDEILHTPADFRNVPTEWNFKFGDVLTTDGNFYIKNGFPLMIKTDENTVFSSQSCRDAFEIRELTVTEILSDDVQQNIQLSLTDENGSSYSYTEHTGMNYDFSIADTSAGKSYLFAVYEDTALLPLEVSAPDGDADGNQTLDILDVISINKAILGKEKLSLMRISHIDFNNNGIPDSEDSLIMMKKIVGLA